LHLHTCVHIVCTVCRYSLSPFPQHLLFTLVPPTAQAESILPSCFTILWKIKRET
jgi:hypothetical protein